MEMSERARAARDKLRATLKADPALAKAFRETLDELRKPENIEAATRDICAGMNAIKLAVDAHNKAVEAKRR